MCLSNMGHETFFTNPFSVFSLPFDVSKFCSIVLYNKCIAAYAVPLVGPQIVSSTYLVPYTYMDNLHNLNHIMPRF